MSMTATDLIMYDPRRSDSDRYTWCNHPSHAEPKPKVSPSPVRPAHQMSRES